MKFLVKLVKCLGLIFLTLFLLLLIVAILAPLFTMLFH